jgi:hypothetical protein
MARAEITLLTLGREHACLDMTRGHDEPYLGAHVANSAGRTGTVLPNPCTTPVKGAC